MWVRAGLGAARDRRVASRELQFARIIANECVTHSVGLGQIDCACRQGQGLGGSARSTARVGDSRMSSGVVPGVTTLAEATVGALHSATRLGGVEIVSDSGVV